VASEPADDEPGWTEVPDRHLLTAATPGVSVQPLAGPRAARPPSSSTTPYLPATPRLAITGRTEGIVIT
jgi:glutamine amidotransferase